LASSRTDGTREAVGTEAKLEIGAEVEWAISYQFQTRHVQDRRDSRREEEKKKKGKKKASPLLELLSEGRDLPGEDGELPGDVDAGEIISRVGFGVTERLGGVNDGGEGRLVGRRDGRRVVVENVGH
jgi:hypothetical protein